MAIDSKERYLFIYYYLDTIHRKKSAHILE